MSFKCQSAHFLTSHITFDIWQKCMFWSDVLQVQVRWKSKNCIFMHFHILLFLFRKGHKVADTKREICDVYDALSANTCERWFARFLSGEFNLQNALRFGQSNAANDNQLLAAVKSDRHLTTREIAERFGIHIIMRTDWKNLTWWKRLMSHEMIEKNIMDRNLVCESLLKKNFLDPRPFLKRIVTGNEKWVVYNIKQQKSWWTSFHVSETWFAQKVFSIL